MSVTEKALPSLKAMAESKQEGIQKVTTFKLDPRRVKFEEDFNVRIEGPGLDAYIESIYLAMKAGAFIPAIDVRVEAGEIYVVEGHCRTRAALRMWEDGVEYYLEARQFRGNEIDRLAHMAGTGSSRPLSPLEAGINYMKMMRYGAEPKTIAEKVGKTVTTITNYLLLAEAPVELQGMIAAGTVPAHLAIQEIQKNGHAKALENLRAGLKKATQAGKSKVTAKTMSERVPNRVAVALARSARSIISAINLSEETPDEQMIQVSAKDLKAMLAAVNEISQKEAQPC